uniref:TM2 domain-containing protein 2 n=1 Tax=Oncorhynchus tshawytscha TaxID=74940 RepID=A0A8C8I6I4_ONCTS
VARISVSYILLCGQVILLLTVLLLQCLEGIHQTHPERATAAFSEHYTELYEYRPPSPVMGKLARLNIVSIFGIPSVSVWEHCVISSVIQLNHHLCLVWSAGTQRCESHTSHLHDIECAGPREFLRGNEPCIKYAGHYFITTLLYSFFLGCFGVDRFCLGHTGTAVGMLLNLGGLGIWWLVDLITGGLMPSDSSNWCTFY